VESEAFRSALEAYENIPDAQRQEIEDVIDDASELADFYTGEPEQESGKLRKILLAEDRLSIRYSCRRYVVGSISREDLVGRILEKCGDLGVGREEAEMMIDKLPSFATDNPE